MDDDREPAPWLATLYLLLQLCISLWVIWEMIPSHRKRAMLMRAHLAGQKTTAACARRAGAASMRAELATGHAEYSVPLGLSRLRDAFGEAYDKARNVTL